MIIIISSSSSSGGGGGGGGGGGIRATASGDCPRAKSDFSRRPGGSLRAASERIEEREGGAEIN